MALVIPVGFAEASIEMRHAADPEPWYCTFGIDVGDAGGDYEAAAAVVYTAWVSTIGLQLSSNVSSTACRLRVGTDGGPPLIVIHVASTPGTSTANMLPQNCAALYDKNTARAGRRGRGRFFVPGILKEPMVSDTGILTSGERSDLQVQADNFLAFLSDADPGPALPMVLLHNAGVGSGPPDPVVSLTVQQTISTQRRRLR